MSSPADIPERDEALKVLVTRFKQDPDGAFAPLADALLSRGHAFEALRVTEHGLDRNPGHLDGRLERAKALLAAGRPKVAYVELQRCLALAPQDRRSLRLLGRVYKEAGVPARAAELLARRSQFDEVRSLDSSASAPPPSIPPADPKPLFFDLAADLGLSAPIKAGPPKRIEVTQVIRRKAIPRPPRSQSELTSIDGPIVETTKPGKMREVEPSETSLDVVAEIQPLFPGGTGADAEPTEDEPLGLEGTEFQLQPVETGDLWLEDEPAAPPADFDATDELPAEDQAPPPLPARDEPATPSVPSPPGQAPAAKEEEPTPLARASTEPERTAALSQDDSASGQDFDQLLTGDIPGQIKERRTWRVPPLVLRREERPPGAAWRRLVVILCLVAYGAGLWVWNRSTWSAWLEDAPVPAERSVRQRP